MVFDAVVGAAGQKVGDHGPFVAEGVMGVDQQLVFFRSPFGLRDRGMQVVVPALPTLLTHALGKVARNFRPITRAPLPHELCEQRVLFFGPNALGYHLPIVGFDFEEAIGVGISDRPLFV